jgi:hypothetical protein
MYWINKKYMDILKKFNLKKLNVFKIVGLGVLAILVVSLVFAIIGSSFDSIKKPGFGNISIQTAPSAPSLDYGTTDSVSSEKSSYGYGGGGSVDLSVRNVGTSPSIMPIYGNGGTTGDQAEAFEVTDYSATIETRELSKTCASVTRLKVREDVIFENSNESDRACGYTFKVKKDKVNEILTIIKNMDPKELSENTFTIKNIVDDYTGELEILEKKLSSIDETLQKAVSAYNDITELATKVQDIESLAKIIDSKINIIERLTQERININSQIERLQRSKTEQLDRIDYAYFYVNVIENKFIDRESIKDSWKTAVKEFISNVNQSLQNITVGLVALLLLVLQYAIYLLILIVIAKYGWQMVKYIWKK